MTFYDYLKTIFLLILILNFLPPLVKNMQQQYRSLLTPKTKVGNMKISGVIDSAEKHLKYLKTFFDNDDIKAIFLEIDSGGGSAGSSQTLFNEIKKRQENSTKPVVVYVENTCASGAYYAACAGKKIIGAPSAMFGSVGVFIPSWQLQQLLKQLNVDYEVFKTGEYKVIDNPFVEKTPDQKALLKNLTESVYNQFIQDVADNREQLSLDNVNEWANGKIFTGTQAEKLGLIDKVGSWSTAEDAIKELAAIEGEIEYVKPPKPSPFAKLFKQETWQELCIQTFNHLFNKITAST